jgi:hypothetical protein
MTARTLNHQQLIDNRHSGANVCYWAIADNGVAGVANVRKWREADIKLVRPM